MRAMELTTNLNTDHEQEKGENNWKKKEENQFTWDIQPESSSKLCCLFMTGTAGK